MFLVGAPLGALIKRGGLGIPVIISILFYIIYYVLNILGLKWAREDLISPFLAAWMSNLLIFPLGVLLLYLARKDSRIFDYNIIESIKTKFLIFQKKQ
jgi:lipopolysaccharide export system permease protein